ncbi:hypothetical protein [Parasphingorhabdus sp. NYA22]
MTDNPYILYSALNISKQNNAICIPSFLHYPDNQIYIPVTDERLKIIGFQPIDEFDNHFTTLAPDHDASYSYRIEDTVPLVIIDDGSVIVVSKDTYEELIDELKKMQNQYGEILSELLSDISSPQSSSNDEDYTIFSSAEEELWASLELSPKNSTLWMDQVIEGVRLEKWTGEDIDIENARLMRIQLLSWAQKLAETAPSRIFSHFTSSLHSVEQTGVYLQDIYGSALLSRMTLDVPRKDRVLDLMRRFRKRYGRGPLKSVQELAEHGSGEFKARAAEVLEKYYLHVEQELISEHPYRILTAAFAADSADQWPQAVLKKLTSSDEKFSADIQRKLNLHQNYMDEYAKIREGGGIKLSDNTTSLIDTDRIRELALLLVQSSSNIKQQVEMLDVLKKVLSSSEKRNENRLMGAIDYHKLELNEDLLTSIIGFDPDSYGVNLYSAINNLF